MGLVEQFFFFKWKNSKLFKNYGFSLNFIEREDILDENKNIFKDNLSIAIIDIDGENLDLANLIKKKIRIPVFGVYNKFNKSLQIKAKKEAFDLTFTKSLLINSIKSIIVHIISEK